MLIIWTTHREVWLRTLKTSPGGQNGLQCSFGKNGLNAPAWLKMAKTFSKLPKATNCTKCAKNAQIYQFGWFWGLWIVLGYFESLWAIFGFILGHFRPYLATLGNFSTPALGAILTT